MKKRARGLRAALFQKMEEDAWRQRQFPVATELDFVSQELDRARNILADGISGLDTVERSEAQVVDTQDDQDDGATAWGLDEDLDLDDSEDIDWGVWGEDENSSAPQKLTLVETYTITQIPQQLLALISAVSTDADTIPTLVLTFFRALSPLYYSTPLAAPMHLCNDAHFLANSPTISTANGLQRAMCGCVHC